MTEERGGEERRRGGAEGPSAPFHRRSRPRRPPQRVGQCYSLRRRSSRRRSPRRERPAPPPSHAAAPMPGRARTQRAMRASGCGSACLLATTWHAGCSKSTHPARGSRSRADRAASPRAAPTATPTLRRPATLAAAARVRWSARHATRHRPLPRPAHLAHAAGFAAAAASHRHQSHQETRRPDASSLHAPAGWAAAR